MNLTRLNMLFPAAALVVTLLLAWAGMPLLRGWFLAVNLAALAAFGYDKRQAVHGGWRVPEGCLLLLAAAGGSPGALAGMALFRHKTRAARFKGVLLVIVVVQVALLLLRGCGAASR